jgi:hypothetical protein
MSRYSTILAAFSLMAGVMPAAAADLHVAVVGRTPEQIKNDVMVAADKVCSEALRKDELEDSSEEQCVIDTVAATMKQLKQDGGMMNVASSAAPH